MGGKFFFLIHILFYKDFFKLLPFPILHLQTYRELSDGFHQETSDDSGEVIRFLGQKERMPLIYLTTIFCFNLFVFPSGFFFQKNAQTISNQFLVINRLLAWFII